MEKIDGKRIIASSSSENVTNVASMDIDCQNVGETETKITTATKMSTETTIGLQESPTSTGNSTTVKKESTMILVFGQIK